MNFQLLRRDRRVNSSTTRPETLPVELARVTLVGVWCLCGTCEVRGIPLRRSFSVNRDPALFLDSCLAASSYRSSSRYPRGASGVGSPLASQVLPVHPKPPHRCRSEWLGGSSGAGWKIIAWRCDRSQTSDTSARSLVVS